MSGLQDSMFGPVDEFRFFASVGSPQEKYYPFSLIRDLLDRRIGEFFPTLSTVRSGLSRSDSECSIEEEDSLLRPATEIAMIRYLHTDVIVKFFVDILE